MGELHRKGNARMSTAYGRTSTYPARLTDARALVLQLLSEQGPLTRLGLVSLCGRSYTAVSRAVDYYHARGVITPVPGRLVPTAGRHAHLWQIARVA